MVYSVGGPAGTMSHSALGFDSSRAMSSRERTPVAPYLGEVLHVRLVEIEHETSMAATHEPTNHVGTHPTQTDHSGLHTTLFELGHRPFNELPQTREPARDVPRDVDPQRAPPTFRDHGKIPPRLRGLHIPERIPVARYRNVNRIVAGHLEKHT